MLQPATSKLFFSLLLLYQLVAQSAVLYIYMGLYIFFLPPYCSEMNPIELEWQHLKKDELSGQIFDDEYHHCLRRD